MPTRPLLKVGTRGSPLALAQTGIVIAQLQKMNPSLEAEIVTIQTTGDKIKEVQLSRIPQAGRKGLFIKEIEAALLRGKIDVAVHSLKDMPTEIPSGLCLGAILKRENPHDCLVSRNRHTLKTLPQGARIGTSSLRRQAQILALRPDLQVENLRGNLDTRIRKLETDGYDAIVVALAGIRRLKKAKEIRFQEIPFTQMVPAVGQGSLAVEVRKKDKEARGAVKMLNDDISWNCAICERSFLRAIGGGCQVPAGALAQIRGRTVFVQGLIASTRGEQVIRDEISGDLSKAESLGRQLAEKLLHAGGKDILARIYN